MCWRRRLHRLTNPSPGRGPRLRYSCPGGKGTEATIDGASIYYLPLGSPSGYPLIVVHGGPGLDHTMFRPWFEYVISHGAARRSTMMVEVRENLAAFEPIELRVVAANLDNMVFAPEVLAS